MLAGAAGLAGTEPGARYRDLASTTGAHPAWWAAAVVTAAFVVVSAAWPVRRARNPPAPCPALVSERPTPTSRGTTVWAPPAVETAWAVEVGDLDGVRPGGCAVESWGQVPALRASVGVTDPDALDGLAAILPGTAIRLAGLVGVPRLSLYVRVEMRRRSGTLPRADDGSRR